MTLADKEFNNFVSYLIESPTKFDTRKLDRERSGSVVE